MEKLLEAEAAPDDTEPAAEAEATKVADAKVEGTPEPSATQPDAAKEAAPKAPEKPVEGAPEEYADFKGPDGLVVDKELLGQFHDLCRKANLPQEKAQGMFSLGGAMVQRVMTSMAEAQEKQEKAWLEEAKADKEIGGERLADICKNAKVFIKETLKEKAPDFQKLLLDVGLGNNPQLIKLLSRAYRATREDASPRSQGGTNKVTGPAGLYPSLAEMSGNG